MYRLLTYHTTKTEICLPFFSFLNAHSRPRISFYFIFFRTVAIDCQPPTEITLLQSSMMSWMKKNYSRKIWRKKKLFRRSPRRGVVLLGLGERRNERKLRISLTWLFCSSSWLRLLINAKRENYYINYSTTRRDFFSIFLTSKALSNSTL